MDEVPPQITKCCTQCKQILPTENFGYKYTNSQNKIIYKSYCKLCENKNTSARERRERAEQINRSKYILIDSRKSDKKFNRDNNLTRQFIDELIINPCSYCGEDKLLITLDRINNNLGHLIDNVVQACIRCNYIRGNMPYDAWLIIAKGVKEARESYLFGSWDGVRCRRKTK